MFNFSNDPNYEIWGEIMVFENLFDKPLSNKIYNDMNKVRMIKFGNLFNQKIDWNKIPKNIKFIDFGSNYTQEINKMPLTSHVFLPLDFMRSNSRPNGKFSLKNTSDMIIYTNVL